MSNERNRLEQEALQAINRGSLEGAMRAYLAILRQDPKDRRIRQRVGELYFRLGKPQEAEKHLRDVADSLVREGNHRGAVAVLKQLVQVRPDDPAPQLELAEAYLAAGYPNDARQFFDTAMRGWIGAGRPADAARAAARLADLAPGEPALRLKVAELQEAAGDPAAAARTYDDVITEYRRRGRLDEVGRVAEMALKVRPDDVGLQLDAAGARVVAADWKRALQLLQSAFAAAPKDPHTLGLLAATFEGSGQSDKALKVLVELSRVQADRGETAGEADALRRAVRLNPEDGELQSRLVSAEDRLSRLGRRLSGLVFAQATDEFELRAQVRAEVYARYGFPDRAEAALRQALDERPASVPLRVAMAETLVAAGRVDEALPVMEGLVPLAGPEAGTVLDRIGILRGTASGGLPEPRSAVTEIVDDAPEDEPPGEETDRARADRLAAAGDSVGALAAYRKVLAEDPLDEEALARIALLRAEARGDTPIAEGTFAEVSPDALDEVQEDVVGEARSLVAVGLFDDALQLLDGHESLDVTVVRAQAWGGKGATDRALEMLRTATNEASETEPGYLDALFELSALYTQTGRHRAASRLLEEVRDLDAGFRPRDVEARLRGLQKLLG